MAHVPEQVESAAGAGVGLMLSGHTHGGQIWPLSYATRAANSFLAGPYQVKSMTLLVSRGAGTWGPRMRLWKAGEILLVTLRSFLKSISADLIDVGKKGIEDSIGGQ